MSEQALMDYFKFDAADLQANRNGRLTAKQQAFLASDNKYDKLFNWNSVISRLLIGVAGMVVAGYALLRHPNAALNPEFGLVFGCLWPVLWGASSIRPLRRALSKLQIQVVKAQGPVNIVKAKRTSTSRRSNRTSSTSHYYVYELHVGGAGFDVTTDLADIMLQGDVYAIYYTQGSERTILSAELVSKA